MIDWLRLRGGCMLLCILLALPWTAGCGRKYAEIRLTEEETQETQTEDTSESGDMSEAGADWEQEEAGGADGVRTETLDSGLPGGDAAVNAADSVRAMGAEAEDEPQTISNGRIVALDAGHQAKGNPDKEPVGPGASTKKAKVAAGAQGISTGLPEYQLTLAVAKKTRDLLEERGYQVVMIRETNDVNLSNADRARIAGESGADILVRIHANSLDNSSVNGTLSMCQTADNPYNGELHQQSYSLSKKITDAVCDATGFKNRGVQETDTMTGINWSTIPVSILEMGFMSNPEEDQKMATEEYQNLIAGGIANGIDAYFEAAE